MDALRVPLEIPLARGTGGDACRDLFRHVKRCALWRLQIPFEIRSVSNRIPSGYVLIP